ncbi:NUDIX domain-containing protein [Streptomyces lydicus]|uniref:NUDIX domain-containing protein n=1 Tax=Streptomyces lydicus TaxID=47763 RepID=UPI0036FDDA83
MGTFDAAGACPGDVLAVRARATPRTSCSSTTSPPAAGSSPADTPEDSDRTLGQAVRRKIAEETGVTELEVFGHGTPVHIDVHAISGRPEKNEPAHVHYDDRYLFRARVDLTLQAEEVGAAQWRSPSELGDPVLRARVLAVLGLPGQDRPTVKNLSCALVVITDPATTKALMHLRDDKPGIWAP